MKGAICTYSIKIQSLEEVYKNIKKNFTEVTLPTQNHWKIF